MLNNLYLYSSKKTPGLYCYCESPEGISLPESQSPWLGIGVLRADQSPPRGLNRKEIDIGIASNGYQLWRKTKLPRHSRAQA